LDKIHPVVVLSISIPMRFFGKYDTSGEKERERERVEEKVEF
jgi:hypothetical protein